MKFIYCFSKDLKNDLINKGFRLISDNGECAIFENNPKLKFNFDNINISEYKITNRLTF